MALKISGPASALLLLAALLAAGARAGQVTTTECKPHGRWPRVRQYPVDSDATVLDISKCSLTGVPQQSISGLPALTVLWLPYNELRVLPVLDEHVRANLTELYLQYNQLTEINNAGAFSSFTKLEILDLSYNEIQFIHHTVFTALTNLQRLYLKYNKITSIPDQMFANNGKLERLYLHGNMITHLPPEFASRLKRAAPNLDVFLFHNNPWHCACLIELLADIQGAGVREYNKGVYDGRAPECVNTGAALCVRPTGLQRAARVGRGGLA